MISPASALTALARIVAAAEAHMPAGSVRDDMRANQAELIETLKAQANKIDRLQRQITNTQLVIAEASVRAPSVQVTAWYPDGTIYAIEPRRVDGVFKHIEETLRGMTDWSVYDEWQRLLGDNALLTRETERLRGAADQQALGAPELGERNPLPPQSVCQHGFGRADRWREPELCPACDGE